VPTRRSAAPIWGIDPMIPVNRLSWTAGLRPASRRDAGDPNWYSRGYLPHIDAPHLVQHIIFRLADSLPAVVREDIAKKSYEDRLRAVDAALDNGYGGRDLASPHIAKVVQAALLTFDAQRYKLIAWCVMPNHVHVLLEIRAENRLDRIVHSWKSYSAKEANRLLERTGTFWAREYFDRYMRDEEHLARTAAYIEGNPVKAGLCENVADWRFSSAWHGWTAGLRPASRRDAGGPGPAV
jgi:REP element-mobilizing transposase RayT